MAKLAHLVLNVEIPDDMDAAQVAAVLTAAFAAPCCSKVRLAGFTAAKSEAPPASECPRCRCPILPGQKVEMAGYEGSLIHVACNKEAEAALLRAFDKLDGLGGNHNHVSLTKLRPSVALPRKLFDQALQNLRAKSFLSLAAAERNVTREDQEAGIREDDSLLLFVSRRQ